MAGFFDKHATDNRNLSHVGATDVAPLDAAYSIRFRRWKRVVLLGGIFVILLLTALALGRILFDGRSLFPPPVWSPPDPRSHGY